LIVQLPNCCFYPSISFVSGACPEVPAEGSAFCFRILIFGVCSELAARNWKQILTIFMRVVALLWLLARFSHSALIPCGRFGFRSRRSRALTCDHVRSSAGPSDRLKVSEEV